MMPHDVYVECDVYQIADAITQAGSIEEFVRKVERVNIGLLMKTSTLEQRELMTLKHTHANLAKNYEDLRRAVKQAIELHDLTVLLRFLGEEDTFDDTSVFGSDQPKNHRDNMQRIELPGIYSLYEDADSVLVS